MSQFDKSGKLGRSSEAYLRSQVRVLERMVRELSQDLIETQKVAKVGTFYFDVTTQKGSWTDQAAINYGFKPGTALNQVKWEECIEKEDLEQILVYWKAISTEGSPFDFSFRCFKQSGESGVIRIRAESIKSEQGKVLAIRGTLQDISSHTQN